MSRGTSSTLALIALVAVVAPVLAALTRGRIPGVVVEIFLGIIIGPQVLGFAAVTDSIETIAGVGLTFLFFTAGLEMDLERVRGRPLRCATWAWGASLALALAAAAVAVAAGVADSEVLIALALTTTAIGTLVPILGDSGELSTPFGAHILAIGAAGEFLPLVAVTLLASGRSELGAALVLLLFAAVALGAAALAVRPKRPRLERLLVDHLHTSSQLPVRLAVLVVVALVWIASSLGLDALLGAFAAGLVVRLANRGRHAREVESKIASIAGGLFVPAFFIVTGMTFDLDSLTGNPAALARVPVFLLALLLVRGLPTVWSLRADMGRTDRVAAALLSATALPLIVAITTIGMETGRMRPENAAALVAAGMLSVLCFPAVGFALRRRTTRAPASV